MEAKIGEAEVVEAEVASAVTEVAVEVAEATIIIKAAKTITKKADIIEELKLTSQLVQEIGNVPSLAVATQTSHGEMNATNARHPNLPEEAVVVEEDRATKEVEATTKPQRPQWPLRQCWP